MHFVAAAFECESENLNLKKCATGYKVQDRARVSQVARTMLSSQTMRHCSAAQRTGPTHTCMCMRSSGHARSWFSNYPSRYAGVLVLVLVPWYWSSLVLVLLLALVLKLSGPLCSAGALVPCPNFAGRLECHLSGSWIPDSSHQLVLEQTFLGSRPGAPGSNAIMQSISGSVRPGIQPCVGSEAVQLYLELLHQEQKYLFRISDDDFL